MIRRGMEGKGREGKRRGKIRRGKNCRYLFGKFWWREPDEGQGRGGEAETARCVQDVSLEK